MGGTVASNPNNNSRDTVYYNGKAYDVKKAGNFSYIEVGNHIKYVDLNDPTWFQQQVQTNTPEQANEDNKKTKIEGKDWLKYFQELIAQGKHDWTEAREATRISANIRYNAANMIKELKQKKEALLKSSYKEEYKNLSIDQQCDMRNYDEQIAQYTEQKDDSTDEMYQHIRERLRADYQIQTACHGAESEVLSRFYMGLV